MSDFPYWTFLSIFIMNNKVIELALSERKRFHWNSLKRKTAIIIFVLTVLLFSNSIIHMIVYVYSTVMCFHVKQILLLLLLLCIYLVSLETIVYTLYKQSIRCSATLIFMCRLSMRNLKTDQNHQRLLSIVSQFVFLCTLQAIKSSEILLFSCSFYYFFFFLQVECSENHSEKTVDFFFVKV